jgi:catecholate siderophore receptor
MTATNWFPALLLAAAFLLPGQAQADSGTIHGKVLDPSGAPIPGAQVSAGGASVLTGESGAYSLTLEAGEYVVHAVKEGFSETSWKVHIPAPVPEQPDIVLPLAPAGTAVTVTEGAAYLATGTSSATKTLTPLIDIPQSITVVTKEQMADQMMLSMADVVRYVPGVTSHQGENNRDQVVIRGNSSSADFFLNGVRDDVQYYRDLYNLDRVEVLKGPNALIFGRGGAGGVINRVTKEAGPVALHEINLQGGSFGDKRVAGDWDQPLGAKAAFRLNGMYENTNSFRDYVSLERYGIAPTVTLTPGENTRVTVSYENVRDNRVADRGIPSFQGLPADTPVSTFFGDPKNSKVRALVNLGSVAVEHHMGRFTIRNRTLFGGYDRMYRNYVPGAVTADKTQVALSGYDNATRRLNIFNQTDLAFQAKTGRIQHTLSAGTEVGRQLTDNFRNTAYFNNSATSLLIPYNNPVIGTPTTFRQSATDADNRLRTNLGAMYVQDQVELSRYVQLVAGVRFDYFDLGYRNNRNGDDLRRIDRLVSPRAGLVLKPVTSVSLYGSYGISWLPSSGDQFSSLTTITRQVKPEKFTNYEAGAKWDPSRSLSLTAAAYRLERTNTRSTDPNDPARIVQTGNQRTNGVELGVAGNISRAWKIAGGYSYQDAFVVSATTAALAGAQVAQVPHNSFSLWNNYQVVPRLGLGLGLVNRSTMFAAIDDTVRLPGYTRADAAVFIRLKESLRLQANVENLLGKRYYVNADGNNNISPGSPRAIRIGLTARF